jgi:hypothetical protein
MYGRLEAVAARGRFGVMVSRNRAPRTHVTWLGAGGWGLGYWLLAAGYSLLANSLDFSTVSSTASLETE